MYKKIYIPVDNSQHSNSCMDCSIALAKATGARLVGSHVYAAKMHDTRFKQMEFTLPDEYRAEAELEKQRRTHDSLIAEGLRLISHSYLDVLEKRCAEAGLPFEKKTFDGRNYQELVKDIRASDYDLVVMGAHGQGAIKSSVIGSVTERVVRRIQVDTLVVKEVQPWQEQVNGRSAARPIVVALDGSPQSFHGLAIGMYLARHFDKPLQAVAVYDPYLHYSIFHSIADVLSDEAAKVFKFKEQEQMHEEVIDTGLAKIYQSHLEVGKKLAKAEGLDMESTLLPGKPFEQIKQYVIKQNAWLLICGRIGVHSEPDMDIGSNCENLMRSVPCHIFLASGELVPPVDLKAQEAIHWTDEAIGRMDRVPDFVRGVARSAVLRWAMERGHSVITSGVIDEAMGDILPPGAAAAMGMAAKVAERQVAKESVFVCDNCGHTARRQAPATCVVCGASGKSFSRLDEGSMASSAKNEGGLKEETAFDGVRLTWTEEARRALRSVPSGTARRRVRARIEKMARVRKIPAITLEFALQAIEEETGETVGSGDASKLEQEGGPQAPAGKSADAGPLVWTEAARQRLQRVPPGFMRDLTSQRIEAFARQQGTGTVTPELVEEKYAAWAAGSEKQSRTLEWEPSALERINRIPDFVRGMVVLEVERCARALGKETVTPAVLERAKGIWASAGAFHSESDSESHSDRPDVTLEWTPEAEQRVQRVPEGFMRTSVRHLIEAFARQQEARTITLEIAEQGIALGRKRMAEHGGGGKPDERDA